MICYKKIGFTEGIDLTKSQNSKECIVCYYVYFNHGFKFQKPLCNVWHDLLMMSPNNSDISIIFVKGVDYHCIIYDVRKSDTIHLLENSMLNDCGFI